MSRPPPSPSCSLPSSVLSCSFSPLSEDDADPGLPAEFSFETDHEALRGNADYLALIRTMAVLQAQRAKAVKDVDTLLQMQSRCLEDPLGTVEKLQRGEGIGEELPGKQVIAELPRIDWEKYSAVGVRSSAGRKPETRNKLANGNSSSNNNGDNNGSRSSKAESSGNSDKFDRNARGQILVRGRVFEEGKPKTFNQPWTPEEQQRLEELLVQFPSEDVEMERWKKIAAALGNRTAIQVQSRTQKYFLKLQKAGLPIPGRQLKSKHRISAPKAGTTRSGRQLIRSKNSAFFPSLCPTVRMDENDDEEDAALPASGQPPTPSSSVFSDPTPVSPGAARRPILNDGYYLEEEDVTDEEGVDEELRSSEEYQELMWLKRVRREQELEQQRPGGPLVHKGFRCDGCDRSPIVGGRFQCSVCLAPDTVDFCCDCAPKGVEVGAHRKTHQLKPVRKKARVDQEYWVVSNLGYLDPNFVR